MWRNLTDEQRKRIKDAGPAPAPMYPFGLDGDHRGLFVEFFNDNCDDEDDRRNWECYWWLYDKDLSIYRHRWYAQDDQRPYRRRENTGVLTKFEEAYGPEGATPIQWPAEVTAWFTERKALEGAVEAAWRSEWDNPANSDDDETPDPQFEEYKKLADKRDDWLEKNPPSVPLDAALTHSRKLVSNWYKAYFDELARMDGAQMTFAELDRDYIDRMNKNNLDELTVGQEVKCLGYGPYVLIGVFPPGYENAVMSYDKAWYGTLTMKERGGAFSPGKVTVTGCEGNDQNFFKETFRRVSKKAITFA